MIPLNIIEKAISGGWHEGYEFAYTTGEGGVLLKSKTNVRSIALVEAEIVLDPTFWQALGKALGWKENTLNGEVYTKGWRYHATRFYNLILTGQPTDVFWQELLQD